MDKLEEGVGPEGRKMFEQFLRKVSKLQAQQQLEAQAQMGVTQRARPCTSQRSALLRCAENGDAM
jgi:hypothetical protein